MASMLKGRGAANDPSPRPSASVIWACGEKRGFSAGDEIVTPVAVEVARPDVHSSSGLNVKLKLAPVRSAQAAAKSAQPLSVSRKRMRRVRRRGALWITETSSLVVESCWLRRQRRGGVAGLRPLRVLGTDTVASRPSTNPRRGTALAPELRDDLRAIPEGRALAVVAGRLRRRVRRAPQIGVTVPIKAKCLLAPQYSRRWPSR